MKLATYRMGDGSPRVGAVAEDMIAPLDCADMLSLIQAGHEELMRLVATTHESVPLSDANLCAPILNPGKIICIGLNYRAHAAESGAEVPQTPVVFAKYANTLVGHGDPVRIPPITQKADYEVELAVVIGRTARDVPADEALDYVFGYTVCNDVSARDAQFADGQWVRGKSFDTFCPLGPWIVTSDEIPDVQDLAMHCRVNGELLQNSSTSEMIFTVAEIISHLSQAMTLEPGDVIATGTPYGVGFARKPPVYLLQGDVVEVEIERIGVLRNPVVVE